MNTLDIQQTIIVTGLLEERVKSMMKDASPYARDAALFRIPREKCYLARYKGEQIIERRRGRQLEASVILSGILRELEVLSEEPG
jgi:hypothetical protein